MRACGHTSEVEEGGGRAICPHGDLFFYKV